MLQCVRSRHPGRTARSSTRLRDCRGGARQQQRKHVRPVARARGVTANALSRRCFPTRQGARTRRAALFGCQACDVAAVSWRDARRTTKCAAGVGKAVELMLRCIDARHRRSAKLLERALHATAPRERAPALCLPAGSAKQVLHPVQDRILRADAAGQRACVASNAHQNVPLTGRMVCPCSGSPGLRARAAQAQSTSVSREHRARRQARALVYESTK